MKRIKKSALILICTAFIGSAAFFNFGNIQEANSAGEWYQSNTGYWVESNNGGYYCEWSYFSSDCESGARDDNTPPSA